MNSLFVINIKLPSEYRAWVNQMVETIVLFLTVHVMQFLTGGTPAKSSGLFSQQFWRTLIFWLLGFSAYHLVVKKLVRFRYVDELPDLYDSGDALSSVNLQPLSIVTRIRSWLKNKL